MRPLAPLVFAALALPGAASAQLLTDPVGDFVPTYTGPQNAALDITAVGATFDGSVFTLFSRSNGDISGLGALPAAPPALFVWGVNRGQGTARFGELAPGVLFDAVVVVNPLAGTVLVNDFVNGTSTPLPVGAVSFAGAELTARVSAGLLPMLAGGFAPSAYTVNLWPRVGAGNNAQQISDFAPDNRNFGVNVIPEPGTFALLLPAAGVLAAAARRRRAA